jgi:site-specific recombinase XerC
LSDVTPHVLRHSFASIGNDLGFTEVTIAALIGHAKGSVTSKYIHTLDTALIMAADTIAGYIQGRLHPRSARRQGIQANSLRAGSRFSQSGARPLSTESRRRTDRSRP